MSQLPFQIEPPFKGIVRDVPAPGDPHAFDDVVNFFCRKSRIHTRPRMNSYSPGPPPDSAPIRGMQSFIDVLGLRHTLVLTTLHAYFISPNTPGGWLEIGMTRGGLYRPTGLPFSILNVIERLYFCDGSMPVQYADGESTIKFSGNVPGPCRFLTTNASHLIGANWLETTPSGFRHYPKRVRWTANGIIAGGDDDWINDPSAGVADLLEVPDEITGLSTAYGNTYVYRTNGISVMIPTGIGTKPFTIQLLSGAPEGIGNIYPYALASYDAYTVSISKDDIWLMTQGVTYQRLAGGKVKKAIFQDLAGATGDQVVGKIIPRIGSGFDFLSYWLSIPGKCVWVYNQEDDNWTRVVSSKGWITALEGVLVS